MSSIPSRLAAAVVAGVSAVVLAACSSSPAVSDDNDSRVDPRIPESAVITGVPAGYNADDVAFATSMISDHKQAAELLKLVPDRSTNPELVALASQISAVQTPEINVMKVLLVQWNENPDLGGESDGEDAPAMAATVDDATMTKLKSLRGAEFDSLWLESMISHQQGAAEIASAEIAGGANVDALALAETMLAQQEAEIEQMKQMLEGSAP